MSNSRFKDPLSEMDPHELESAVRKLLQVQSLKGRINADLLVKGAHLAQDHQATAGLPNTEINILNEEKNADLRDIKQLLAQTWSSQVTIMTTACAAICLGWQQSAINTSGVFWPTEFGIADEHYKIGAINALPMLTGSILGTLITDPLQGARFGRRMAMMIGASISVACCIWSYRCTGWKELLACRAVLGVGIGTKASVAPIFAAEAAVDRLRGRILTTWQLFDALGIALGFVTAVICPQDWRVQLGSALIPAAILMVLVYLCPESPRLLMRKKRYYEAYQSLRRLRNLEIQAARDFCYIHFQLQQETKVWKPKFSGDLYDGQLHYQKEVEKLKFKHRVILLFSKCRNHRAALVAFLVMASQQLCGINLLAFYSSSVFQNTGSAETKARWMSFGFGLTNFLSTIPALVWIDDRGRRFILMRSFVGMTLTLLGASFAFDITSHEARLGVVVCFVLVFTFFYSIGAGPVPFTLSAEIFPLAFRELGMSFSVMVNFLLLGLLVLFVPPVTSGWGHGDDEKGQRNVLLLFTGFNAMMTGLLFIVVRKTEDLKLEQMNALFGGKNSTWDHVKFQAFEMLPYIWQKWRYNLRKWLRRKDVEEPSKPDYPRLERGTYSRAPLDEVRIEQVTGVTQGE